jgi:poly-gamma-glutamate capsule biosynthesis protein CapA/YwtB (metallophosphatase superfamily)
VKLEAVAAGEKARSRVTIALLGDVMLGRGVAQELDSREPEELWAPEVREVCRSCDLVVCNLECCISGRGRPTGRLPGKPFFFRGPPAATGALAAIGVDVAGLANNHALDYETEALADTIPALEGAGVAPVGAGENRDRARAGVVVATGGSAPASGGGAATGGEADDRAPALRLGVVAASDHPSEYAATESSPGIAYAELSRSIPAWLLDKIGRLRRESELVLAFLHWGPNMTASPAPWQRERAAELVEAGADAVAGHSAHVFHGVGFVGGAPLLYDLGDALDDYAVDRSLRNDLGVIALWRPDGDPMIELLGLRLDYSFTRLATDGDAEWIAARLERACGELGTAVERVGEQRFALGPA